jgi:uncharacterized Tic20 family protein
VAVAPAPPSTEERTWALLAHLGAILIGFIAPLVAMLTKGTESAYVRRHAVEALNFNLTLLGALLLSFLLSFVGIGCVLLPLVLLGGLVLQIIAGVKANSGEDYRYPLNLRVIH